MTTTTKKTTTATKAVDALTAAVDAVNKNQTADNIYQLKKLTDEINAENKNSVLETAITAGGVDALKIIFENNYTLYRVVENENITVDGKLEKTYLIKSVQTKISLYELVKTSGGNVFGDVLLIKKAESLIQLCTSRLQRELNDKNINKKADNKAVEIIGKGKLQNQLQLIFNSILPDYAVTKSDVRFFETTLFNKGKGASVNKPTATKVWNVIEGMTLQALGLESYHVNGIKIKENKRG